jgi:hypothetical protein
MTEDNGSIVSDHIPSASGPRCARHAVMAVSSARDVSSQPARVVIKPVIPHIGEWRLLTRHQGGNFDVTITGRRRELHQSVAAASQTSSIHAAMVAGTRSSYPALAVHSYRD